MARPSAEGLSGTLGMSDETAPEASCDACAASHDLASRLLGLLRRHSRTVCHTLHGHISTTCPAVWGLGFGDGSGLLVTCREVFGWRYPCQETLIDDEVLFYDIDVLLNRPRDCRICLQISPYPTRLRRIDLQGDVVWYPPTPGDWLQGAVLLL